MTDDPKRRLREMVNDDLRLKLSNRAKALILAERDAEAINLIDRASKLLEMSAIQYVARGLSSHALKSNELIGMMSRVNFSMVEYDESKPGWRCRWEQYEGYKDVKEIIDMFAALRK